MLQTDSFRRLEAITIAKADSQALVSNADHNYRRCRGWGLMGSWLPAIDCLGDMIPLEDSLEPMGTQYARYVKFDTVCDLLPHLVTTGENWRVNGKKCLPQH